MSLKSPVVDEIWSLIKENQKGIKEIKEIQKETALQMKETDRQIQKIEGRFNER